MKKCLLLGIACMLFACKKETAKQTMRTATSAEIKTESWMHDLQQLYAASNFTLKDIMIPAAHDAGMYQLTSCTFGANTCNTQTQNQSFQKMLMQGIRMFDVRPKKVGNKFYTFHATDCDGLGCNGAPLASIYSDINTFLNSHAELVVLELSHFCHTAFTDTALINLAERTFGAKLLKDTNPVPLNFLTTPLAELINSNHTGNVLLIYEGVPDVATYRANGLFAAQILPKEGQWTNSQTLQDLKTKQLALFSGYSNSGNTLFQFNWQITLDAAGSINCALNPLATSISDNAKQANLHFIALMDSLVSVNEIRKDRIPNIVYYDFCDSTIAKHCIQISKLSLQ